MAYVNAFENTVEYCDQNKELVIESTANLLCRFFRDDEGQPVPGFMGEISTLDGHSVAGDALTVNVGSYYMIEMLFVHPSWQRQGIASGLLCILMNKISGKAIPLISRCNLANIPSENWHRKCGFKDIPDLQLARIYYNPAVHEQKRDHTLKRLSNEERLRLQNEIETWYIEIERA